MVHGREPSLVHADEVTHVHPGERLVRTFELWHRVVRIRLLDARRSAGRRFVRFANLDQLYPSRAWSDEDGLVEIVPMRSGPLELAVWALGVKGLDLDRVAPVLQRVLTVPFRQRVASFEVQLPPA